LNYLYLNMLDNVYKVVAVIVFVFIYIMFSLHAKVIKLKQQNKDLKYEIVLQKKTTDIAIEHNKEIMNDKIELERNVESIKNERSNNSNQSEKQFIKISRCIFDNYDKENVKCD